MKNTLLLIVSSIFFIVSLQAEMDISRPLDQLLKGNERYVQGKSQHTALVAESKDRKKMSEQPIAVIVGCSDARVPPEIIFDQGVGELFIVRVAGNVLGPIEL